MYKPAKILVSLILFSVVATTFYWFELRPSTIRKNCSWIHEQSPEIKAISGDESVIVPNTSNLDLNTWEGLNAEAEAKLMMRKKVGSSAVSAMDYWRKSTSKEYDFCLRSNGLEK